MRDARIQAGVRAVRRGLAGVHRGDDPVHPEGPGGLPQAAPGQQVPVGPRPGERHRLHLADGHLTVPVVQPQDTAGGDGLLDRQRDRRCGLAARRLCCRLSRGRHTGGGARPGSASRPRPAASRPAGPDQPEPVHQPRGLGQLPGRGHRQHLAQRAASGDGERRLLRPGQRHGNRGHLSRGEIDRRERARFADDIPAAPAGLRADRGARLRQRQHVPLDRARADLIPPRQLPRRPRPGRYRPQLLHQRVKPTGPVHGGHATTGHRHSTHRAAANSTRTVSAAKFGWRRARGWREAAARGLDHLGPAGACGEMEVPQLRRVPPARPAGSSPSTRITSGSRPSTTSQPRSRGRIAGSQRTGGWCATRRPTGTGGRPNWT